MCASCQQSHSHQTYTGDFDSQKCRGELSSDSVSLSSSLVSLCTLALDETNDVDPGESRLQFVCSPSHDRGDIPVTGVLGLISSVKHSALGFRMDEDISGDGRVISITGAGLSAAQRGCSTSASSWS